MQLAVNLLLADAAGNQLCDLRTEVEDQDSLVGHGDASNEAGGPQPPVNRRAMLNRRGSWELPW
jgi:hypothetical protein